MSYFYSQPMTYCEGIMPRQVGWESMNELGRLECVQFEQKILDYDSPFIKSMKRCQQNLHKINEVKSFISNFKQNFELHELSSFSILLNDYEQQAKIKQIQHHQYLNNIEDEIIDLHKYFITQKQQLQNQQQQINSHLFTVALLYALKNSKQYFQIISSFDNQGGLFQCKCFLANRKDLYIIQKGLFRISRGNTMIKTVDIQIQKIKAIFQHSYEALQQKVVCILLHQGGSQNILTRKIQRFLSCIDINLLRVPPNQWQRALQRNQKHIKQVQSLQKLTNQSMEEYLHKIYETKGCSGSNYLSYLQSYMKKQKQIYRQLSCLKVSQNFLHFHVYIPTNRLPLLIQPKQHLPPLTLTPKIPPKGYPTKFDTLEIMEYPQKILDTYGVPSYGQFNPAVFYIISFGFFIGVMFGDVGHMLMMIPFLIYFRVNIWFWTIIFFMGYSGLIYNQFFGLSLSLSSSCYQYSEPQNEQSKFIFGKRIDDCVCGFGVDPVWKTTQNRMQFVNSLKMKMSVILGVIHMLLGLFVRVINCINKRKYAQLFTLAVPQIIFMLCTFFYMDILIFVKWNTQFIGQQTKNAPSIISTMIEAFTSFGQSNNPTLWDSQRQLERALSITALLMVPIMLLGVPIIKCIKGRINNPKNVMSQNTYAQDIQLVEIDFDVASEKMKNSTQQKLSSVQNISSKNSNTSELSNKVQEPQKHESIKQLFVHQFIETIEYVLGAISNTASYLRLWALSLAHSQLAQVIFSLILQGSITGGYSSIPGVNIFIYRHSLPFLFSIWQHLGFYFVWMLCNVFCILQGYIGYNFKTSFTKEGDMLFNHLVLRKHQKMENDSYILQFNKTNIDSMRSNFLNAFIDPLTLHTHRDILNTKPISQQQYFVQILGNLQLLEEKQQVGDIFKHFQGYQGSYSWFLLMLKYLSHSMETGLSQNYDRFSIIKLLTKWVDIHENLKKKQKVEIYSSVITPIQKGQISYEQFIVFLNFISLDILALLKSGSQSTRKHNLQITIYSHLKSSDLIEFLKAILPKILQNLAVPRNFFPKTLLKSEQQYIDILYSHQTLQNLIHTKPHYIVLVKSLFKILFEMDLASSQIKDLIICSFNYYYLFYKQKSHGASQIIIQSFKRMSSAVRYALRDELIIFLIILRKMGKQLFINYLSDKFAWIQQITKDNKIACFNKAAIKPYHTAKINNTKHIKIQPRKTIKHYLQIYDRFSLIYFSLSVLEYDLNIRFYYLGDFDRVDGDQQHRLLFGSQKKQGVFQGSVEAVQKGIYMFQLDNSYSWVKSKTVSYDLSVLVPLEIRQQNKNQLKSIIFQKLDNLNQLPYENIRGWVDEKEIKIDASCGNIQKIQENDSLFYSIKMTKNTGNIYEYQSESKMRFMKKIEKLNEDNDNIFWMIEDVKVRDLQQIKQWIQGQLHIDSLINRKQPNIKQSGQKSDMRLVQERYINISSDQQEQNNCIKEQQADSIQNQSNKEQISTQKQKQQSEQIKQNIQTSQQQMKQNQIKNQSYQKQEISD